LIQSGSSPYTAAQRLVEQPAIHHQIHGQKWRLHLNRSQEALPPLASLREYLLDRGRIPVTLNQTPRVRGIICLSKHDNYCFLLPRTELEFRLQGSAWIETDTCAIRKRYAPQSGWRFGRAVSAKEFSPVTCVRHGFGAKGGKRDSPAIIPMVRIARK
jgi:hypothetical protein